MTQQVKLLDRTANEVMDMVYELRAQGLVQGRDFDFAYHQSRWDEMIGEIPKTVVFDFYTEKYATLFAIKYQ
jgi:hypothetical protein